MCSFVVSKEGKKSLSEVSGIMGQVDWMKEDICTDAQLASGIKELNSADYQ